MHDVSIRRRALDLLAAGTSRREVCRLLGVGYNSTYRWEQRLEPRCNSSIACFRCDEAEPGAPAAYSYLLANTSATATFAAADARTA